MSFLAIEKEEALGPPLLKPLLIFLLALSG
jgi:hypothetical protein